MIIAALQGGLGNQMFQYAFGLAVSLENGTGLKLDRTHLSQGIPPRDYELGIFGVKGPFATKEEISHLKPLENWLTRNSPKVNRFISLATKTYFGEKYSGPETAPTGENLYLEGYFQSEDYFKDHAKKIREVLKFRNVLSKHGAMWARKIKKTNSVSVHVRRTDYVNRFGRAQIIGCDLTYYATAMKYLKAKINQPLDFFVFSDDPEWASANLKFKSFQITCLSNVAGPNPSEDLKLMTLCRHNIVANSSFSWWGAWLNSNPSKIVIAPDPWFEHPPNIYHETVPSGWVKILKNEKSS